MPKGARAPFGQSNKFEEKRMKRIYGMAILAAFFALAAPAQDLDAKKQAQTDAEAFLQKRVSEDLNTEITTMRMRVIGMVGGLTSNVKNAPYKAEQITGTTQTLGDGTRIHNEHTMTIYRDSQGRVRRELPDEVSIMDPNTGVGYTLNTKDLTYRKMAVSVSVNFKNASGASVSGSGGGSGGGAFFVSPDGPAGTSIAAGGGRGENVRVIAPQIVADGPNTAATYSFNGQTVTMSTSATTDMKKESLGTQTMEGVSAQGERRTSTIEAGTIGNDRPIQIVSERWYSPDLQMDVMTRHSDPRTGEEVMRLANINRAEPDASLFVLPAGYQLVEGGAGRGGRGGRQ
jgi:hypothetical protein